MNSSKGFSDNWFINGNVGMTNFYGDMSDDQLFASFTNDVTFGAGIVGGKMILPFVGVRGQLYFGQLKGTRDDLGPFGEYFLALQLMSGNIALTVNVNNLISGYKARRVVSIYGLIGVGHTWWKARRYDLKTNKILAQTGFGGKLSNVGEAMGGFGFNFRLSYFVDLNIENTWHVVNSDNVDTKIGGFKYDTYMYTSIGISYKFGFNSKNSANLKQDQQSEDVYAKYHKDVDSDPADKKLLEDKTNESDELEYPISDMYIPFVKYKVQVDASFGKPLPVAVLEKYYIPAELKEEYVDGWYRYTAGNFLSFEDAKEFKNRMISQYNAPNAIVLAYRGGTLIKDFDKNTGLINTEGFIKQYNEDNFNIVEDESIFDITSQVYKVQIDASFGRPLPLSTLDQYKVKAKIIEEFSDGWYRYTVGYFMSFEDANEYRRYVSDKFDATNALILAYKNGSRVYDFLNDNEFVVNDDSSPDPEIIKIQNNKIQNLPNIPTVIYSIQFVASKVKITDIRKLIDNNVFSLPVYEYFSNNWYKYSAGGFNTYSEAQQNHKILQQNKKMKDCFIVGYKNGIRLTNSELQAEINKN